MGRDDEDTDGEKNGDQIVDDQTVCHLFDSRFLSSHEKPFSVGKLVQRVCV